MPRTRDRNRPGFRNALITLFLAFALVAGGCGGGGGGGGGGGDVDPILLALYQFLFQTQGDGLIITLPEGVLQLQTTAPNHFNGTYDTVGEAWTVASGSRYQILDVGASQFGNLTIIVTSTITVPNDDDPTAGAFQIFVGSDRITVTIDDLLPGVTIQNDVGANGSIDDTVDLTWDELDEIDDMDPLYQQIAEFVGGSFEFILLQSSLIVEGMFLIDENADVLLVTNPLQVPCDPIDPPFTPVGLPTPGNSSLAWIDTLGDGDIGPGDDFLWVFQDCWINDPADDIDNFFNGSIRLLNYVENVDVNDRITRIGFEGVGGGVMFEAFSPAETETDAGLNVTVDPGDVITIDGQITLVFFE